ncbi:MAG: carboxylesterase/lipase family protein [Pseudomonadota bacterium]
MKQAALALLVAASAALVWLYLQPRAESEPTPVRDDVTIRETTAGAVVGFTHATGAHAWLGIPYAAAPTGERRWRAPAPPAAWSGIRDALTAGPRCPQKPSPLAEAEGDGDFAGQEDCLYLNVWAPAGGHDLPVMFWIHGGGNTIGSGDTYLGAHLATREDVVVITINYRLGPLGWFAHPALARGNALDDSGNFGTLDIIRALEWTRENVAAFGGDPGNVTVFGESAGAFNTLAMMASPRAKGLFHRAISQSGGFSPTSMRRAREPLENGGHPNSATEVVNQLLLADGTVTDRDAALALQRDMSDDELRAYLYDKPPEALFALFDGGGFGMIDTPDTFADGQVIPDLSTREFFSNADNHNRVPVILGSNRDEPALFMAQDPRFVEQWLWIFPRLKDEDDYLRRVKYGALAWKARGVDELAAHMSAAGNHRVFAYRFDWDEEGSRLGYDLSKALGAAHFLEIPFVFGDFDGFPMAYLYDASPGKEDLSRAIMGYWGEFARHGHPGRGSDGQQPAWLAWGEKGQRSLLLDTPQDADIRMTDRRVTRDAVVRELATDADIPSQRDRCELYVAAFRWEGAFDYEEYAELGAHGCHEFDPQTLAAH